MKLRGNEAGKNDKGVMKGQYLHTWAGSLINTSLMIPTGVVVRDERETSHVIVAYGRLIYAIKKRSC